jgi:hypothetical protein
MVPLSWVMITGLLSISSMLSASILSLPFETFKNQYAVSRFLNAEVCTDSIVNSSKAAK